MIDSIAGVVLVAALVVAPLAWRARWDRRREQALVVQAEVQAAIDRYFQGQSFLVARVEAPTWRRAGRVLLAVPAGWDWLVQAAWGAIVRHVPDGYELVVPTHEPAHAPLHAALKTAA
jgi:hypothetical protein